MGNKGEREIKKGTCWLGLDNPKWIAEICVTLDGTFGSFYLSFSLIVLYFNCWIEMMFFSLPGQK